MAVFARRGRLYIQLPSRRQKSTGLLDTPENREKARRVLDVLKRRLQDASSRHPVQLTLERAAERWMVERRVSRESESWLYNHVLPTLGATPLAEVRVRHVARLMAQLEEAGRLAPRSRLHVYRTLSTFYRWCLREELITVSPCQLARHELPRKVDKDPEWRVKAVFTRHEAEALMACHEIPDDRRVFYALLFFTGARPGEVIALRWSDVLAREPLDGLQFARAYNTKQKQLKPRTKTGATKVVPIHAELATILEHWRSVGWARRLGRAPTQDDLIVPMPLDPGRGRRAGGPRTLWSLDTLRKRAKGDPKARSGLRHGDLERAGVPVVRALYEARSTFITATVEDGLHQKVAELWTHDAAVRTARDGYFRPSWSVQCREMAKLAFRVGAA